MNGWTLLKLIRINPTQYSVSILKYFLIQHYLDSLNIRDRMTVKDDIISLFGVEKN